jgi:hypothetical protein
VTITAYTILIFHYHSLHDAKKKQELFFSHTISDWIRLPQPLVLSRSVETFKAAVRILYEILMYEICKNVLTIFNPYVQTLT